MSYFQPGMFGTNPFKHLLTTRFGSYGNQPPPRHDTPASPCSCSKYFLQIVYLSIRLHYLFSDRSVTSFFSFDKDLLYRAPGISCISCIIQHSCELHNGLFVSLGMGLSNCWLPLTGVYLFLTATILLVETIVSIQIYCRLA